MTNKINTSNFARRMDLGIISPPIYSFVISSRLGILQNKIQFPFVSLQGENNLNIWYYSSGIYEFYPKNMAK